ncbi:MAG TPA: helix-turn-helix domain-containing protein [Pyrinomonadaceae bacterium]|jgi:tetratricopeptide (TPR) repeat protein
MNLTEELTRRLGDPTLSRSTQAGLRCRLAQDLTERGDYEAAREALGELWPDVAARPNTAGLERATAAELLLRAGALAGLTGGIKQIAGAQERAKDWLSESMALFEALCEPTKVAAVQIELAYCYFRAGALDEARAFAHSALARLPDTQPRARANILMRTAMIEAAAARFNDALTLLTEAAPLFEGASDAERGRFHMERAIALECLSADERRPDYADRALVEYTAASVHFEQAGHVRNCARVENNVGHFLYHLGRYEEAHAHLDAARQLFANLGDAGSVAQVDETRARLLLAEGRAAEAERAARAAVAALTAGDQQGLLAEALTTHGTALARVGHAAQARNALERAFDAAERAGELEGAGRAELAMLEELFEHMTLAEAQTRYLSADALLGRAQDPALAARLRACARRVLKGPQTPALPQLVAEANERYDKCVEFTPAALAALERLPLAAEPRALAALVERTVAHAAPDALIDEAAVEVVALRQNESVDLSDPWAGFSLKEEVQRFEERLIEQALKEAHGMVSHAARLLGFRHHETLNWRLKNRNKSLLEARKPIRPRRRSIIRHWPAGKNGPKSERPN